MGLQGRWLAALIGALAVVAVLATVLLWPRLATGGSRRVLARVGLIVLCQLSAVLAIGVAVNDYFDFYVSWGDLFGTSRAVSSSVTTYHAPGAERGARAETPQSLQVNRQYGPADARPGRLESVTIPGASSRLSGPAAIYLPPQYADPAWSTRRMPVAMVLAGYPGHIGTLEHSLNVPGAMDSLMSGGRVRPMVLVMLTPTLAPPRDTECADVPHGPQVETYLTQDVPAWVSAHYRVAPAGSWGILGTSTGGFCAAKLGMRHPDVFPAAVAMSGYLHAITDVTTGDLYGGSESARNLSDPLWRVQHPPSPPLSLLLTASKAEHAIYPQVSQFVAQARPPLEVSTLVLPSGGHNFGVWARELPTCLQWLSLELPGRVGGTTSASGPVTGEPPS